MELTCLSVRCESSMAKTGQEDTVAMIDSERKVSVGSMAVRGPIVGAALAETVLRDMACRRLPARLDVARDDSTDVVFVMPAWLLDRLGDDESAAAGLRVTFSRDGSMSVVCEGPVGSATEAVLRSVLLRARTPLESRRRKLVATARGVGAELEAHGVFAPDVSWLQAMLDYPRSVEREGLGVWHDFVECCDVPESFLLPGRQLSLADLLLLRAGDHHGRHRLLFANNWPWAARQILDGEDAEATLSMVDANPADSIKVAARYLCCSGEACEKAVRFSKVTPRHRLNAQFDHLLGAPGEDNAGRRRGLLMEAHSQDRELLTHIGSDCKGAAERIGQGIDVVLAYLRATDGGFDAAYGLGALLVRAMVRNPAFDPTELDPESVALGLAAVSADCMAAFAAEAFEWPAAKVPHPDADVLDTGALAFLFHVGEEGRPRLTAKQLVRFLDGLAEQCEHRIESVKTDLDGTMPAPPGLSGGQVARVSGGEVRPLRSVDDLAAEGRWMRNCLRDGRYQRAALLGRLALLSVQAGEERATLALRPVEEHGPSGATVCKGWETDELRGPGNDDPSAACVEVASSLIALLERACPIEVPAAEIERRTMVREALDRRRTFNSDPEVAQQYWDRMYIPRLPRSFGSASPRDMVARYFASAD